MRIGSTIREIREFERNLKRSYVAEKLSISTRAYANIENNQTDITLNRLEEISNILECSIEYLLHHKEIKSNFQNNFNNNEGNRGLIYINQSEINKDSSRVETLLKELLICERKRIALLEALLRSHNIQF